MIWEGEMHLKTICAQRLRESEGEDLTLLRLRRLLNDNWKWDYELKWMWDHASQTTITHKTICRETEDTGEMPRTAASQSEFRPRVRCFEAEKGSKLTCYMSKQRRRLEKDKWEMDRGCTANRQARAEREWTREQQRGGEQDTMWKRKELICHSALWSVIRRSEHQRCRTGWI